MLSAVVAEAVPLWVRGCGVGGNVIVRCGRGHLFTTIRVPAVSVKSLRLGPWRLQRCPTAAHWSLVTPVRASQLAGEQRQIAGATRDIRLP